MRKYWIVVLLVLLLTVTGVTVNALEPEITAEGTCGESLTWKILEGSRIVVEGTGDMYDYAPGEAPWVPYQATVYELEVRRGVTSIGAYGFYGMQLGGVLHLSDTVTEIREYAFSAGRVPSLLELPDSVTTLGKGAFQNSEARHMLLKKGPKTIGESAFEGSTLESLSIRENMKNIGTRAFADCKKLAYVNIYADAVAFGDGAFSGCTALTKIYCYGKAPKAIGENAFAGVTATVHYSMHDRGWTEGKRQNYGGALTYISYDSPVIAEGSCGVDNGEVFWSLTEDGVLTVYGTGPMEDLHGWYKDHNDNNKMKYFNYWRGREDQIREIRVLEGVTHVGDQCFAEMPLLEKIVLADSVESVGMYAFCGAPNLKEISFGKGIRRIGTLAFMNCGLESLTLPAWDVDYSSAVFASCKKLSEVTVPEGVTGLGQSMFDGCEALEEILLPQSLKIIGGGAFEDTGLIEIVIPKSVEEIGGSAFKSCGALKQIEIPVGVREIGNNTFENCVSLEKVILPEGLTKIGNRAFENCDKLRTLTIPSTVESISHSFAYMEGLESVKFLGNYPDCSSSVFGGTTTTAYYPSNNPTWREGFLHSYNGDVTWVGYESAILPDPVLDSGVCGENVTWELRSDYTLVISGTGEMNTWRVSGLWDKWDARIYRVIIERGVTDIGRDAFDSLRNLQTVVIADTVTVIGDSAFHSCSKLDHVIIPGSVTEVKASAFTDCASMKELYFLGDMPVISNTAFSADTVTVYYPGGNTTWSSDKMLHYEGTVTWVENPHKYIATTVPPSCTEQGYTRHDCVDCGELYTTDYTEPLGHKWADPDVMIKTCTLCGAREGGYRIEVDPLLAGESAEVWIDGARYEMKRDETGCYVELEQQTAQSIVIYSYNDPGAVDVHTQYPTGMKVWILEFEKGEYTARYIPEFDDLLQYSGSSIRITGTKGIRMITSIPKDVKKALTDKGLAGYTLEEYGTALAWAGDLEGGAPLILGQPYTKSNYAYKKGVADPVFKNTGTLIQYTNVLVGFTDDQCVPDIAMRPYMILQDAEGSRIVIYGGVLYRSIGYIAYQNRNAFKAGSSSYEYVWGIIHHVYGTVYDAEYKG